MFDHSRYIFLEIPTYLGFRNIYYKSKCFLVVRYEGHCSIFIITPTRARLSFDFVKLSVKLGD